MKNELERNLNAEVVTPVLRCDPDGHRMFMEDRKADRVGGTTAVFTIKNKALYFSKEVIPYTSKIYKKDELIIMKGIKESMDRKNIMNPGKIIDC